ncbi:PIG-L family deacetylase [Nitriliruptor alkaliphilus]|uniref:PIG-L family deacetylase n=1 Tax=Nitriliruptor alkaliphilus TaxID=427918 RepID=UPI0009FA31CE|nr:PIG-L family deacetylase [Nitriliruptor alkaliphilus]
MTRPARVLAFVAAHPDDDVMGAVGLVALHRDDPELRFVLIHATDGAAGQIAPGSGATPETLGHVRRDETRRAWELVRPPDRHEWLGYDDGALDRVPVGELAGSVGRILAEERPDVVLTFGPDGISGHPDHIAIGAATTDAFHALRDTPGPGFRRLFHGAFPRSALDRVNELRVAQGHTPFDPTRVYEPRGVPDELIACTIDQRAVALTVRDAFRQHRTQWAPPWTDNDDADWIRDAGRSHLVQAWPPWGEGTPCIHDPFEGL